MLAYILLLLLFETSGGDSSSATLWAVGCSVVASVVTQLVLFSYTWGRASKDIESLRESRRDFENRLRDLEYRRASS